ncbi:amidase family protein [Pseudonocardia sp.]|uniref:amidase family protein n=1 Tax=Pseudonocardia sp. TaxID=60912 RepID=UPI003D12D1EF
MSTEGLDRVRERVAGSSSAEVVGQSIEAIHGIAELGAFLAVAVDAPCGPGALAGVPVAVKDNLDTRDFVTTGGTPALRDSRPGRDHLAVERLRAAGAAVVGKTNLHELALGITSNNAAFGPVRNPHDPARSAGGSSGGSAVAVATGVVPVALGSDTGGSVRVPAAHCGVVGFRPTVGRWGNGRCVPISHTRDTAGAFATSVADVAEIDAVVTGAGTAPVPERLRIGVPRAGFYDDLHPDVAAGAARALDRLADAGVELVERDAVGVFELDAECGFPIVFAEIVEDLPGYLATLPGPEQKLTFADVLDQVASPDVRGVMEAAASGTFGPAELVAALEVRDRLRAAYAAALDGLDAIIYPTVPLPAPPLGDDDMTELNGATVPVFLTSIRNTAPGSTAGMPSISLPGGVTSAGLPVGISLEGLPGQDAALLAVAAVVERVLAAG